ncbi:MAG TPA: CBS domain-containing protein [Deltaproteobacteria bacterium]|nr:MAG: histidine kinase [Deltaproteobacteria bacterium]RLB08772.1 MAG: histidine kinase [Deltaproteobacteria bacterium]HDM75415.1 CBS domain-containing protein [Deltaproteobacteria bacterium]
MCMKVKEIMTTRIEQIDADQTVFDAIEKMIERRIRSLVVKFPGEDGADGIVTARDIVFKVIAQKKNLRQVKISEIASKPLICVDQQTELGSVAELMEESNVERVFVRDDDKIIGVVALLDIMAGTLIMRARGQNVI